MAIDVVSQLPQLTWGGRPAFCSSLETSGGNRLAQRMYPYVDGAAHDDVGAEPLRVRATLHFLNSIPSGGEPLYPEQWAKFRDTLDGISRQLAHPDLGEIRARVTEWSYAISTASASGVNVQVSWEQSLGDLDEVAVFTSAAVDGKVAAAQVAEAMDELGIDYPTGAPEGDLASSVVAIIDTGFSIATDINGEINKVLGTLDRIESSLERSLKAIGAADAAARDAVAGSPARWLLQSGIDSLRAIFAQLLVVAQAKARETSVFVTTTDTSIPALAQMLNNTIADIIGLNPGISAEPTVRKGTSVRHYV
jgi:prophage DNA circulation protein